MRNGCIFGRKLALGDPRREHNFKLIHALPMPFITTLKNAAIKYWLSQKKPPVGRRRQRGSDGHASLLHLVLVGQPD
jgi:hypothetical protein